MTDCAVGGRCWPQASHLPGKVVRIRILYPQIGPAIVTLGPQQGTAE